ncbi:MAG: glycosyltransferase [Acidimicrobiia bacterium]|nr:glycosyltransferase [Acidimicrobiia bacterium]
MKVLQIHTQYRQPGGEDSVASNEAELLRSAGHEVIEHREQNPADPLAAASDMIRGPWNPAAGRHIRDLVESNQPDVTHIHNTWYHLSPSVFRSARQAGSPTLLTLHNYRLTCANAMLLRDGKPCEKCVSSQNPWYGVRYRCYLDNYAQSFASAATIAFNRRRGTWRRDVDLILALTDFARDRFIESGVPENRITVKPNFVHDPGPRTRPVEDSDSVLFVGRLTTEKAPDVLVDAWERAGLDYRLDVIGVGPLERALQKRNLPNVNLRGQLDRVEVREAMLSARALVLPSIWYEGLSMVLLEAMAAGLPVVASEIGPIPEVVAPLGEQWLARPGDADHLATRLALLRDDAAVTAAGAAARARYLEKFSATQGLADLEAVYERVARTISDGRATRR